MNAFSIALVVSSFVVTLTGDILLDRGVRQVVEQKGIDHLFSAGIDSLFQHSDAVVGNLECPATKIHAPVFKQYIFRAEPEWLNDLKRHGLTHLNLANNHSIDQGRKGLIDTKQNILQAGLIPIGAGQNQEEAAKPILLTEKPRKVWLIASLQLALENFPRLPDQPCVNQQSIDMLCQRIALMKQEDPGCYIIVSLHWGWENHVEVVPRQRYDAHQLIDAGADCLVCHHTHTRQPNEIYQGKPIFYGLGNFIFDSQKDLNSHGAMVRLTITPQEATAEELPIVIRQCCPVLEK